MNSICKICFDIFLDEEELVEDEGYLSHKECYDNWAFDSQELAGYLN
jgi:hypothetical protein